MTQSGHDRQRITPAAVATFQERVIRRRFSREGALDFERPTRGSVRITSMRRSAIGLIAIAALAISSVTLDAVSAQKGGGGGGGNTISRIWIDAPRAFCRLNNPLVDLELTGEDEANRPSMSMRPRHEV